MNFLEKLLEIEPNFKEIKKIPMRNSSSEIVGWSAYAYDNTGRCLAGGTSRTFEQSLRVCVAEILERKMVAQVNSSPQKNDFLMHLFESSCGFAAGFEREKTQARATCEAIERWAWSKWIDEGYRPQFVSRPTTLSQLTCHNLSNFEDVQFAEKKLTFSGIDYHFGATIGFTKNGAFIGSRVCHEGEDPWEHSSIESYRSLMTAENHRYESEQIYSGNVAWRRTIHFANEIESAKAQMYAGTKIVWPILNPSNFLSKEWDTRIPGFFVFRSVFKDYVSWDFGPDSRFVY